MLSTRNLSQALAKYLSPKVYMTSQPASERVALPHPPKTTVTKPHQETPFSLSPPFGPSSTVQAVPTGLHKTQLRFNHYDVKTPDFDYYRKESGKDANVNVDGRDMSQRAFTYLLMASVGVTSAHLGKNFLCVLASQWGPSAAVLAVAQVEVDLSAVPAGKNVVVLWRGKPLFVRHRTSKEIAEVRAVDHASLIDPQRDEDRVQDERYLVVIGVCTHLGCIPVGNAGSFGGYFCPCHGSHYDASGRIRKGPAPLNLEVPAYNFISDDVILVGTV